MSNVVKYLESLQKIKKQFKKDPNIINFYKKYHVFVGPIDSVNFIQKKLKN